MMVLPFFLYKKMYILRCALLNLKSLNIYRSEKWFETEVAEKRKHPFCAQYILP
jgi:hypothetical protein